MKELSRRDFMKGALAAGGTLAMAGVLGACSNGDPAQTPAAGSPAPQGSGTPAVTPAAEEKWDYEAEVAVVGSGCSMFGVMEALHQGHSVVVVEKSGILGGTTITSGGTWWVPNNHKQGKNGLEADLSEEEVLAYIQASDTYNGSTDEMRLDYLRNAPKVFEYVEGVWGHPIGAGVGKGDYYELPGHIKTNSRLMRFLQDDGSFSNGAWVYSNIFNPAVESSDKATVLLNTTATELIKDASGRVIGFKAVDKEGKELRIKGEKGVILGAGSFDRNKEMCRQFLRGPLYGTLVCPGATGDGHKMGMAVGADLDNMGSTLDGTVFLTEAHPAEYSAMYDWGNYRGGPYTILVNKNGRRFANESASYGVISDSMYNFDHKTYSLANIPGYLIFTDKHVELYGWPNGEKSQPEWVGKFNDLDSLAAAYGIDAEALKEEVAKFNGYCETGVDKDFARGEGVNESNNYSPVDGLVNMVLGKVEAPYYVVMIGPGSIGTNGGLKINPDAQVIHVSGDVIPGLYAVGCNAANPFGSSYTGGGASVGPGMYQAFRAVNHMLGLGLV